MKYTKGPWKAGKRTSESGKIDLIPVGRDDYTVCSIHCYGDNAEDNAALIAKAPEMLEALKAIAELASFPGLFRKDLERIINEAEGNTVIKYSE
jgi:hypothetical protein